MKKEEKPKPKPSEAPQQVSVDVDKKFEVKVQKIEENICQWIAEETTTLKDTLEKDIASIRNEVDAKNIDMNSKVQGSIHDLKNELNNKVAEILRNFGIIFNVDSKVKKRTKQNMKLN